MKQTSKTFSILTTLLLVVLPFVACNDLDGSKQKISGNYAMYVISQTDSNYVEANVNTLEHDSSEFYQNNIELQSCPFILTHFINHNRFAGGLTISLMNDKTTKSPTNYSSITGNGALTNSGKPNYAYFVGDLSEPCQIIFNTPFAQSPKTICVANAAYTYLCMRDGWTHDGVEIPAFTDADYLTLRIEGLKDLEGKIKTGTKVEVTLAADGIISNEWKSVPLAQLGKCRGIEFTLISTHNQYNSSIPLPLLFCIDALQTSYEEEF